MFLKKIETEKAPKAIGPYSQAVKLGDFVYLSGAIPVDPITNNLVEGNIEVQAKQVMENIKAVLAAMNLEMRHIVKTTCYLANMDDFAAFNNIYSSYLNEPYPARSCVEVSRLPKGALVEVECFVIDTLVYERQMQQSSCSGCQSSCEGNGCDGGCCGE